VIFYLDSSVALEAVFLTRDRGRLIGWLTSRTLVSSRLLRTEVIRALRREGKPTSDASWLLERTTLIDITRLTHVRAEAIERHTKTLDALHMATVLGLDFTVTVVTRDVTMRNVAEGLGLSVTGARED
jgi:rRNA maturation endonuclease Nob1